MPRADGSIVIDTKLDTKQLEKNLDGLGKKLKSAGKTAAGMLAGGVAVAVAAIGAYTIGQIGAAEADRAGVKAQMAVAKSMGIFGDEVEEVTDRLGEYASTQAMLLGIDDDIIRSTQTKLLTFKELAKTAKQPGGYFDRAVATALDLQAAGFGDAASNAVQLGKALNDPIKGVTALARSGITFTEVEKDKIKALVKSNRLFEAQGIVLRAIEKQVGGTALASAKASDRIRVAFDEMGEAFGYAFLPLVDALLPAVSKFVTDLQPLMATLGTAIADLLGGIGTEEQVLAASQNLGEFLGKSLEAATPFISTALQSLLTTVAGMIPSMAEAIGLLASNLIGTLAETLPVYIQAIIDGMLALIQALADSSDEWITPMVAAAVDIVTLIASELTKQENINLILDAGAQLGAALIKGFVEELGVKGGVGIWLLDKLIKGGEAGTAAGASNSIGNLAGSGLFGTGTIPNTRRPGSSGGVVNQTINYNQPVRTFAETIAANKYVGRQALR